MHGACLFVSKNKKKSFDFVVVEANPRRHSVLLPFKECWNFPTTRVCLLRIGEHDVSGALYGRSKGADPTRPITLIYMYVCMYIYILYVYVYPNIYVCFWVYKHITHCQVLGYTYMWKLRGINRHNNISKETYFK